MSQWHDSLAEPLMPLSILVYEQRWHDNWPRRHAPVVRLLAGEDGRCDPADARMGSVAARRAPLLQPSAPS